MGIWTCIVTDSMGTNISKEVNLYSKLNINTNYVLIILSLISFLLDKAFNVHIWCDLFSCTCCSHSAWFLLYFFQ